MARLEDELSGAAKVILKNATGDGINRSIRCEIAVKPLLIWRDWYLHHKPDSHAKELLDGIRAAVLESIVYISFGLGRATIGAIRTQIDLFLSFSFFRDHPAEWKQVIDVGKGFRLKSDILKYHGEIDSRFTSRLATIEKASGIELGTIYKILSAHIHGQSPMTIPKGGVATDLVWTGPNIDSVIEIQEKAAMAVSNFLLAAHAPEWAELPDEVVIPAKAIIPPGKRGSFFA